MPGRTPAATRGPGASRPWPGAATEPSRRRRPPAARRARRPTSSSAASSASPPSIPRRGSSPSTSPPSWPRRTSARPAALHGLAEEHEDIRTLVVPLDDGARRHRDRRDQHGPADDLAPLARAQRRAARRRLDMRPSTPKRIEAIGRSRYSGTRGGVEEAMIVAADLPAAVGNTPLIRLRRASEATGCEIWGKAEFMNPGQSVKDRAALWIIRDAVAQRRAAARRHHRRGHRRQHRHRPGADRRRAWAFAPSSSSPTPRARKRRT